MGLAFKWNSEVIFDDGDLYFIDLIEGLRGAKISVCFETYIFEQGVLGDRICEALIECHRRGCVVRVLVDGIGSPNFDTVYGSRLRAIGVGVRLFRWWPWRGAWSNFFSDLMRVNRGTHRKFCLVDNTCAWLGSFNVSDVHLGSTKSELPWSDLGVRVEGEELKVLERSFMRAFEQNKVFLPLPGRRRLLLLNSAAILRRRLEHHYSRIIRSARERIWIQTPYFVPVRGLYARLITAAQKGVDVRIMVPANHDVPVVKSLSYAFFHTLLTAGVRIFESDQNFPHQKIVQVDDQAFLGSSNLNHRSFLHDLELDIAITWHANRDLLRAKFLREQDESREISLADLRDLPWWKVFWSRTLLLVRYWF